MGATAFSRSWARTALRRDAGGLASGGRRRPKVLKTRPSGSGQAARCGPWLFLRPALRHGLLAFAVVALAGCGFRPIHATYADGAVSDQLSRIYVAAITDRVGQRVRNQLIDRLTPKGVPSNNAYRLEVKLTAAKPPTALTSADLASRRNFSLTAQFTLTGADGKKALTKGSYRALASYDVVDSEYATLAAVEYAEGLAAVQVADVIFTRLSLYFTSQR